MLLKWKQLLVVVSVLGMLVAGGLPHPVSAGKEPGSENVAGTPGASGPPEPAPKKWRLDLVGFVESPLDEEVQQGILDGLREQGITEGRDFEIRIGYAQGDMPTLNSLIDRAVSAGSDMLVALSTPALQVAIRKTESIPIVFASACPVQAGAGESFEKHLPNVTGVSTMADFEEMVKIIRECLPDARRIGTLFNPGEANSVILKEAMDSAFGEGDLGLVAVPVMAASDLVDATTVLLAKSVDAICPVPDNANNAGFAAIVTRARQAKKPLFCFSAALTTDGGAAVGVSRDLTRAGKDMASLAARIMRGENPEAMPFALVSGTWVTVNLENARLYGLTVPPPLLKRANEVKGE